MDQEKIGKFILKLRKDKKMTQQELADRLSVTDRAVSHWENGRSIPDVSLFKSICEIFDISVNELISGEKLTKEKLIKQSDENIINTLKDSKKNKSKSQRIITFLIIGIIILLIAVIIGIKNKYPKIDLFNFTVQQADLEKHYKLEKQITINNRTIYYYGIDFAFFCDKNEKCYQIVDALKHNQITIDEFRSYLNKQVEYDNYKSISMWDGGTTIYKKSGKEIIFCNTLEGNKDIYIGSEKMEEELKGNYCGHESNNEKTFIRTYYIISAVDDNEEDYIDVTLRQFQGTPEIVKIDKSANIVVGRNYEFTFRTYIKYDDTTKNIFENSTILKIEETNKTALEQINQAINVNDK